MVSSWFCFSFLFALFLLFEVCIAFSVQLHAFSVYLHAFSVYLQHIQDPWLLSTSDVERERAVDTILTLLQTFRDNMLLTVGGVSSEVHLLLMPNYVGLIFSD